MSRSKDGLALVETWRSQVGAPLQNALRLIQDWSNEGTREAPRSIGFQELKWRAEGHLDFDGTGYLIDLDLLEVIVGLAESFKAEVYASIDDQDPVRQEEILGSTIAYDFACQIADQNIGAGYEVPKRLHDFKKNALNRPKRPKGRGDDAETRILRDRLSAWAIQRGVDLGLKPSRNREPALASHADKMPCVSDLVLEIYRCAGWKSVTYDMVLSAHTHLHYDGTANNRRVLKRSYLSAINHQFGQLDDLLKRLLEEVKANSS